MKGFKVFGLCLAISNGPMAFGSVILYSNDFESSVGSEWSLPDIATTPSGRHFLGQDSTYGFSNGNVTLAVGLPDKATHVRVSFDVYVIGSWNGNTVTQGPDLFYFTVETPAGLNSMVTTFSNMEGHRQSYPGPFGLGSNDRWTGAVEHGSLGYANELDAVYRFEADFPHDGGALTVAFGAVGLEPFNDENWGLDNINVSIEHLPEPGSMLLVGLPFLLAASRRHDRWARRGMRSHL